MSELSANTATVDEETPHGALVIEPGYLDYLRTNGYPIVGLKEVHSVESESREMGHVVALIETYDKPEDSPDLDIVADTVELWTCSCEDFQYTQSADVSENLVSPSQCGTCKHIKSVSKVEKAKSDDAQRSLTDE